MTAVPRTLIVSPVPCTYKAGSGALMSALFSGWPKDRLATIYSLLQPDEEICCNNLELRIPIHDLTFGNSLPHPRRLLRWLRHQKRTRSLYRKALDFARTFKPEVLYVYCLGNHLVYVDLARSLAKKLGVPMVIHVMDDWPALHQRGIGTVGNASAAKLNRLWIQTFREASVCLGISETMRNLYQERYGIDFIPVANGIDFDQPVPARESYERDDSRPFQFHYFGGLSEQKEYQSLQEVARAIHSLHEEGLEVELHIHTSEAWTAQLGAILASCPEVKTHPMVDNEEYPIALAQADALVIALNFDETSRLYLGVSIQNKIPEYMASGTPILAYGHESIPSIEYAKNDDWALTVTQQDPEVLKDAIRKLVVEPTLRESLGRTSRERAVANHHLGPIKDRFVNALAHARG